jgi:hypothetical protein
MEKRAIAYTAEIILGNTGEVVSHEFQKARIEEYAKENGIEIIAWFEEGIYKEHLFAREKLAEMLTFKKPYEYVLVERVAAISRKWTEVKTLLNLFGAKHARMECATTLWDGVSQMARTFYRKPYAPRGVVPCSVEAEHAEATSVNLVEAYGRSNQTEDHAALASSGHRMKARRPSRVEVPGMGYKTA